MEAIPLVVYDPKTKKHVLDKRGLEVLNKAYDPITPIAVISIVGLFRTGKSYLIDRIAKGLCRASVANGCKKRGLPDSPIIPELVKMVANKTTPSTSFQVGHTHNSTTHGIFIYPVKIPLDGEEVYDDGTGSIDVIILDTEGLGATERSQDYDHKIYALSMLLSSIFIYNGDSTFGRSNFETLGMAAQVLQKMTSLPAKNLAASSSSTNLAASSSSKNLAASSSSKNLAASSSSKNLSAATTSSPTVLHVDNASDRFLRNTSAFAPSLFWVMRDANNLTFHDSETNKPTTPSKYLSNLLKSDLSDIPHIADIRNVFDADRVSCYPLQKPSQSPSILSHLDTTPDSYLDPDFVKQCDALVDAIVRKVLLSPKRIEGCVLKSCHILTMLKLFVTAMNDKPNAVPQLSRAWSLVVTENNDDAYSDTLKTWKEDVGFYFKSLLDERGERITTLPLIMFDPYLLESTLLDMKNSTLSYMDDMYWDSVLDTNRRTRVASVINKDISRIVEANKLNFEPYHLELSLQLARDRHTTMSTNAVSKNSREVLRPQSIVGYVDTWLGTMEYSLEEACKEHQLKDESRYYLTAQRICNPHQLSFETLGQIWHTAFDQHFCTGAKQVLSIIPSHSTVENTSSAMDVDISSHDALLLPPQDAVSACIADLQARMVQEDKNDANTYSVAHVKRKIMYTAMQAIVDTLKLDMSLPSLDVQYKILRAQYASVQESLASATAHSDTLSNNLALQRQEVVLLRESVQQLHEQCAVLTREKDESSRLLAGLMTVKEEAARQLAELEASRALQTSTIDELDALKRTHTVTMEYLMRERNESSRMLIELENTVDEARKYLTDLEVSRELQATMMIELDALRDRQREMGFEKGELEARVAELMVALECAKTRIPVAEQALVKMETQLLKTCAEASVQRLTNSTTADAVDVTSSSIPSVAVVHDENAMGLSTEMDTAIISSKTDVELETNATHSAMPSERKSTRSRVKSFKATSYVQ